jgi:hypothetical protein
MSQATIPIGSNSIRTVGGVCGAFFCCLFWLGFEAGTAVPTGRLKYSRKCPIALADNFYICM